MKIDKYSFPFPEKGFLFDIQRGKNKKPYSGVYHLHPFAVELQYIRSGAGFYFIKNRRYPLKNKSLFIIHGCDIHSYIKGKSSSVLDKTSLTFSNDLFKGYASLHPLVKKITVCGHKFSHQIYFDEKETTEIEFILDILRREYQHKGLYRREAVINALGRFLIIIERVISKKKSVRSEGERHILVDKVLAYIDKHFKEPITLSLVSKHVYRSPYHISHLFNKFTGFRFREYLINRRITEAKQLLETDSTDKIISVALEAGFSDLSTFNRNFKRLVGMSPSQYRKFCISFRK